MGDSTEETRRVVERWTDGEKEAGDELVRRYQALLAGRARTFLSRTSPLAMSEEDLVQEAWLLAFRAVSRRQFEPRGRGAFGSWLQRILERTGLNELRKQRAGKRDASVLPGLGVELDIAPSSCSRDPTPTSEARLRELAEFCRRVLGEREWEVWRRVEIECRPAVEVAREMSMSDSAVRALVHRSRRRLLIELSRAR